MNADLNQPARCAYFESPSHLFGEVVPELSDEAVDENAIGGIGESVFRPLRKAAAMALMLRRSILANVGDPAMTQSGDADAQAERAHRLAELALIEEAGLALADVQGGLYELLGQANKAGGYILIRQGTKASEQLDALRATIPELHRGDVCNVDLAIVEAALELLSRQAEPAAVLCDLEAERRDAEKVKSGMTGREIRQAEVNRGLSMWPWAGPGVRMPSEKAVAKRRRKIVRAAANATKASIRGAEQPHDALELGARGRMGSGGGRAGKPATNGVH